MKWGRQCLAVEIHHVHIHRSYRCRRGRRCRRLEFSHFLLALPTLLVPLLLLHRFFLHARPLAGIGVSTRFLDETLLCKLCPQQQRRLYRGLAGESRGKVPVDRRPGGQQTHAHVARGDEAGAEESVLQVQRVNVLGLGVVQAQVFVVTQLQQRFWRAQIHAGRRMSEWCSTCCCCRRRCRSRFSRRSGSG